MDGLFNLPLAALSNALVLATGKKFSLNDVVIKAAALALRSVPQLNAVNDNGSARLQPSVDISVAVATPRGE